MPVPRGIVVACLLLLTAVTWAPPAGAASLSLPVAQERLNRADVRLDRLDRTLARLQSRLAPARDRAAAARTGLADARRRYDAGVAAAGQAGAAARRSTIDKNAADERAGLARAAVQRLARTAYMHSSTGGELAVMVGVAVGGPQSLADYAAGDLAVDRVQTRVVTEARDAAAAAQSATASYRATTAAFVTATRELGAARAALVAARSEVIAADADGRWLAQALRHARHARAGAVRALASARTVLAKVRRAAIRRARTSTTLPGPATIPVTSGNQAAVVWNILRADGFTEQAAAGILGNLQQESNIDPTAVQFDGPGMGLAQWSRGGRWDTGPSSLLAYAAAAGLDPWDARTQTRFMIVEMSAGWGGFDLSAFKRRTDVVGAAVYFHDVYEVSADTPEQVAAVRGGYALQWYAALAG